MIYYKNDYTPEELREIIVQSNTQGFRVIDYEDHLDVLEGRTPRELLYDEIRECRSLLISTDYICYKITEAQLESPEVVEALKTKYVEVLESRRNARTRINELEEQLAEI